MLDINTIYTGAALAGSGALIYSLKALPNKGYQRLKRNLVYNVKIYQYDELFEVLEQYLYTHFNSKYKDVEATISLNNHYPGFIDDKEKKISYKQEETNFLIKFEGKNLIISKAKEKLDKAQGIKELYFRKFTISGYRAKKQIDSFLNVALQYSIKNKQKNLVKVYSNNGWGEWMNFGDIRVKPLDKTIIDGDVKKDLIKELEEFKTAEQWYLDSNIAYKRGFCLYGPPGTGKTTLALAIANCTERKVHCLNLNAIESDARLAPCFSAISENSILLIEDIDKVFSGRENVKEDSKISFSALLNCLDGAFYKHGLITIITTNHIEKLDEALLRTGRIDTKIEIPLPTSKEISEYLSIFYNKPNFTIEGDFNLKMSDIQEICLQNKNSLDNAVKQLYGQTTWVDIHLQCPEQKMDGLNKRELCG